MTPEHQQLIERIRTSAEALQRAVAAVPPDKHAQPPRAGEWSAQQVLDHARNVVMLVYGLRIRRLLYEDDPRFATYDEDVYRAAVPRQPEPVSDLLEMIAVEHQQVARLLATLPDEHWRRQGRHPESGAMSVEFLARRVAEHAEEHAAQIANII